MGIRAVEIALLVSPQFCSDVWPCQIELLCEYEPQLFSNQTSSTSEPPDLAAHSGISLEDNERRQQELTTGEPAFAFLLGSSHSTPQHDYHPTASAHLLSVGH